MRIVAIGGGDMLGGETAPIDRRIIELTGKPRPRALFLPTASFDDRDYARSFQITYGKLGCDTDASFLWDGYSRDEIEAIIQATKWNSTAYDWEFRGDPESARAKVEAADLIYVGGGNTRRMVELWRSIGFDHLLLEAADRGTVLSGLSAGCICWGRYGNSDAALTEDMGKPTMRVEGLDFLPIALCPHMSREGFRLEEFRTMMTETPAIGIGLDDGCALEVVDGEYRFLTSIEGAVAHRLMGAEHTVLEPAEVSGRVSDWEP
jgi:dipeptidase E